MTDYAFFTGQLRFVAKKTERETDDVAAMMDALARVADQVDENNGIFKVKAESLRVTARALAGVAGLLQQHILPEVAAAQNVRGERQVRWSIDTCMSVMADLMAHAELTNDGEDIDMTLPPFEEAN